MTIPGQATLEEVLPRLTTPSHVEIVRAKRLILSIVDDDEAHGIGDLQAALINAEGIRKPDFKQEKLVFGQIDDLDEAEVHNHPVIRWTRAARAGAEAVVELESQGTLVEVSLPGGQPGHPLVGNTVGVPVQVRNHSSGIRVETFLPTFSNGYRLAPRFRTADVPWFADDERRHDEAIEIWEEAISVHRTEGFPGVQPASNMAITTLNRRGDAAAAMDGVLSFEASRDPFARPYDAAFIDGTAAQIHVAAGEIDEAWKRAARALATFREHDVWPDAQADTLGCMSEVAFRRGEDELAIALLLESLDTIEGTASDEKAIAGGVAFHIAEVLVARHQPQIAAAVLDALEQFEGQERPYAYFERRHDALRRDISASIPKGEGKSVPRPPTPKQLHAVVRAVLE